MTGRSVGTVLRLLMAAAVVAAIVTQLVNQLDVGASLVNFFSFFTIQSNIIGVVAVTSAALAGPAARRSLWLSQLRGAATLYMGVTGMISACCSVVPTSRRRFPGSTPCCTTFFRCSSWWIGSSTVRCVR
jgi:hypothetical protein